VRASLHRRVKAVAEASPADPDLVLSCTDLDAGYGDIQVVSEFSLRCSRAEVIAIVGPNGSGKSTLLKRLSGVLPHRGGSFEVKGSDASGLSARDLNTLGVQYVPQVDDVFPSLTVEENLLVGYTDKAKLAEILGVFPMLERLMARRAGRLSGGERKALAVGRALMHPDIAVLMLDEPSAGLSPRATSDLWPLVQAVAGRGVAVLIVEQRVDEVLAFADQAYVVVNGRNRLVSSAADLLARIDELGEIFVSGDV
jgi:branched-chain amino acid transport system ATP-binding protein